MAMSRDPPRGFGRIGSGVSAAMWFQVPRVSSTEQLNKKYWKIWKIDIGAKPIEYLMEMFCQKQHFLMTHKTCSIEFSVNFSDSVSYRGSYFYFKYRKSCVCAFSSLGAGCWRRCRLLCAFGSLGARWIQAPFRSQRPRCRPMWATPSTVTVPPKARKEYVEHAFNDLPWFISLLKNTSHSHQATLAGLQCASSSSMSTGDISLVAGCHRKIVVKQSFEKYVYIYITFFPHFIFSNERFAFKNWKKCS